MLNVIMMNVFYDGCHKKSIILGVLMMCVVMLNVIMQNVVAPAGNNGRRFRLSTDNLLSLGREH
jgi:hypothetical protein